MKNFITDFWAITRVFRLHHWFESWNSTYFLEYCVNQYNHVGFLIIWPIPGKNQKRFSLLIVLWIQVVYLFKKIAENKFGAGHKWRHPFFFRFLTPSSPFSPILLKKENLPILIPKNPAVYSYLRPSILRWFCTSPDDNVRDVPSGTHLWLFALLLEHPFQDMELNLVIHIMWVYIVIVYT